MLRKRRRRKRKKRRMSLRTRSRSSKLVSSICIGPMVVCRHNTLGVAIIKARPCATSAGTDQFYVSVWARNVRLMVLSTECMKTKECSPLKHHYDECAERVQRQEEEQGKAQEDCVEECEYQPASHLQRFRVAGPASKLLLDPAADTPPDFHMMHCAAQCAAPKLFKQLR